MTFIAPNSVDYFKDHKIVEVFSEYDGLKVYSFLTTSGETYLAYFCEEDKDGSTWFYIPTSNANLDKLVKDEISIRQFFTLSGMNYLAKIKHSGEIISATPQLFSDTDLDCIPADNVYLESDTTILTIKVDRPGITPSKLSDSSFIKIISAVHKGIKKSMSFVKSSESDKYSGMTIEPRLAVAGISPGSVEIRLKSIESSPLLKETIQKIESSFSTNGESEIKDIFLKEIYPVAPNSKSRLFNFEELSISSNVNKNTGARHSKKIVITSTEREQLKTMIERDRENIITLSLNGLVREYDKDNETFDLRNLSTNEMSLTAVKCSLAIMDFSTSEVLSETELLEFLSQDTRVSVSGDYNKKQKILEVKEIHSIKS